MAVARRDIAGLVLVGGRSSRMGRPKALVELAGIPLWRRAVDLLVPHVTEVLLLGDDPGISAPAGFRRIDDAMPQAGPLGGLLAGLEASGYEHHLLLAVDYPLVRDEFLRRLKSGADSSLAVCGRTSDFLEPLVGYYHCDCASAIRTMLGVGESRAHQLFNRVHSNVISPTEMSKIDPAKWSHFNVNTPADLIEAESRLRSGYPT